MPNEESGTGGGKKKNLMLAMVIAGGLLAGIGGFLPLFAAMRLSLRLTAGGPFSAGLCGLGGVFVSLIVLSIATIACGIVARGGIIGFVAAEGITFLGLTIVYVLFKLGIIRVR